MARRPDKGSGIEAHPLASIARPDNIRCMRCEQDKPAVGARPFHSLMVCADCSRQVMTAAQKGQAQRAAS